MSQHYHDVLDNKNIIKIANSVSSRIGRLLTKEESRELLYFIRRNQQMPWGERSATEISQVLINTFTENKFTHRGRAETSNLTDPVDVHEILKYHIGTVGQEVNYDAVTNVDTDGRPTDLKQELLRSMEAVGVVDTSESTDRDTEVKVEAVTLARLPMVDIVSNVAGFLGKTDETSVQQLLNPRAAYRKNYIILDSRYRNTTTDTLQGIPTLNWSLLTNSSNTGPGVVNSLGNLQQLVSITCPNIRIPYTPNILINSYKRVTMFIQEFSGQSYIGQENRRFHFIYNAILDGNMIDCQALFDERNKFEFAKPITQLDTLTISFGCPLEQITFDNDRLLMAIGYNNPGQLTSAVPHKLQTGDQVYISTFTTADPVADAAAIAAVNIASGINIEILDDYTVELPGIDLSALAAPIAPLNILVYFGSKRVFIPLELTYIAQAIDSDKK